MAASTTLENVGSFRGLTYPRIAGRSPSVNLQRRSSSVATAVAAKRDSSKKRVRYALTVIVPWRRVWNSRLLWSCHVWGKYCSQKRVTNWSHVGSSLSCPRTALHHRCAALSSWYVAKATRHSAGGRTVSNTFSIYSN
jgi:hypothetical protein